MATKQHPCAAALAALEAKRARLDGQAQFRAQAAEKFSFLMTGSRCHFDLWDCLGLSAFYDFYVWIFSG